MIHLRDAFKLAKDVDGKPLPTPAFGHRFYAICYVIDIAHPGLKKTHQQSFRIEQPGRPVLKPMMVVADSTTTLLDAAQVTMEQSGHDLQALAGMSFFHWPEQKIDELIALNSFCITHPVTGNLLRPHVPTVWFADAFVQARHLTGMQDDTRAMVIASALNRGYLRPGIEGIRKRREAQTALVDVEQFDKLYSEILHVEARKGTSLAYGLAVIGSGADMGGLNVGIPVHWNDVVLHRRGMRVTPAHGDILPHERTPAKKLAFFYDRNFKRDDMTDDGAPVTIEKALTLPVGREDHFLLPPDLHLMRQENAAHALRKQLEKITRASPSTTIMTRALNPYDILDISTANEHAGEIQSVTTAYDKYLPQRDIRPESLHKSVETQMLSKSQIAALESVEPPKAERPKAKVLIPAAQIGEQFKLFS